MFGKKRSNAEQCASCDRLVRAGQKVCSCGSATSHMDFAERAKFEVEQWRAYRDRAATAV